MLFIFLVMKNWLIYKKVEPNVSGALDWCSSIFTKLTLALLTNGERILTKQKR